MNEKLLLIMFKIHLDFFSIGLIFLLLEHYLEQKSLNSNYILLQAFSQYVDRPAWRTALDIKKYQSEILKLIAIVFLIGENAAPAKLSVIVIQRLWSDKDKEKKIFVYLRKIHTISLKNMLDLIKLFQL